VHSQWHNSVALPYGDSDEPSISPLRISSFPTSLSPTRRNLSRKSYGFDCRGNVVVEPGRGGVNVVAISCRLAVLYNDEEQLIHLIVFTYVTEYQISRLEEYRLHSATQYVLCSLAQLTDDLKWDTIYVHALLHLSNNKS